MSKRTRSRESTAERLVLRCSLIAPGQKARRHNSPMVLCRRVIGPGGLSGEEAIGCAGGVRAGGVCGRKVRLAVSVHCAGPEGPAPQFTYGIVPPGLIGPVGSSTERELTA